jgi:ASPIC and UnbV/FG-GAP-like repeat
MKRWSVLIAAGVLVALVVATVLYVRRPRFDMVATLAGFAAREGTWDNQWDKMKEKLAELRAALATETDPQRRYALKRQIANHALFDGDADAAIATLEEVRREFGSVLPANVNETVKADLAFAHLRRGETENCAEHHTSASCLFPIQGEGVHTLKRGSTEAVKLYGELLSNPATNSDDALTYRWLLNLGYMTLGQYPDGVPQNWLIPPEAFKSDYDIGRFPDEAASRGLTEFGAAGGIIVEDFDNDGHLDVMISHMGIADQLEYFHNNGDGTFTRMTEQAGLKGLFGGLNLVQTDYNNDGCIDVFIPRGAWLHDQGKLPASLLRNNCDGTFTDVTAEAGLLNYYPTQTAAWADVNNDGFLDLFVGYEIDKKVAWPPGTKNFRLYLNNGNGTFTEAGATSGIALEGMVKGATWGDYDNDGWPDLYVSILGGSNHLFHNLGKVAGGTPQFEDVTAKAGVGEPFISFTCWFFDYNNDGWPDIFVSGYSASLPSIAREYLGEGAQAQGERPRLYRNNKDGTFTDVSHEVGIDKLLLTMGANYGDLDNDGFLDFYLGTGQPHLAVLVPNRMFRNNGGKSFQDVTTSGGFGHLQKGHAVAFGDIDNSGNQDVVEVMGGVYPSDKFWTALYKNPGHGNHWVKLSLVGQKANRFAVGGRLRLVVKGKDGARREIFSTVSSGGSFGASSLRPHIGIGPATEIELLEVKWPGSGTVQDFKGLAADQTYEIREGRPAAKVITAGTKASARATR